MSENELEPQIDPEVEDINAVVEDVTDDVADERQEPAELPPMSKIVTRSRLSNRITTRSQSANPPKLPKILSRKTCSMKSPPMLKSLRFQKAP